MASNVGAELDVKWISEAKVNFPAVQRRAEALGTHRALTEQWQAAWLLRAVTCIDLTTLSGDDTEINVTRLCLKALNPVRKDVLEAMDMEKCGITVGAICVYPARVKEAVGALKKFGADKIPVASVATGFPSGQYDLKTRLDEIRFAVTAGAKEIDVVVNRNLALNHKWKELYDEIKQMKGACGGSVKMKTILATGDLGSLSNVYKCSLVAMMAGTDFIKTSTGKEAVNAILPVGVVMCRAIRDYNKKTGQVVGFKPAGGIRTAKDALAWVILIKEELGDKWLNNKLFRIGASGLLTDIERQLYHYVTGRYAADYEFSMP